MGLGVTMGEDVCLGLAFILQGKQRDLRLEKDGTSGFCMSRDGTSHLTDIELLRGLSRNGIGEGDGRYGLGIYTSRLKKLRWKTFSFSIIRRPWGLPLCRINIDDVFVAYTTDVLSGEFVRGRR